MIRREVGRDYHLITQDDHARLSGRLARRLGNAWLDRPEPFEKVVRAIGLHDCGWPAHDESPTLDEAGRPTDVFESPQAISLAAWEGSVEKAMEVDSYVGLLVSLHVLALSALPASSPKDKMHSRQRSAREVFELNKFQHRQIEIQEQLRRQLGLRTDRPLTLGLIPDSDDPNENALMRNLRLLQAMDLVSLALCCTQPPATRTGAVRPKPNRKPAVLNVQRQGNDLLVHPWPFDAPVMACQIQYRAVEARVYEDEEAFRRIYAAARPRTLVMEVREG